jgi:hypothetical protein
MTVLAGAALTLGPQVLVLGTVYFLLGYLVYGTLMATPVRWQQSAREPAAGRDLQLCRRGALDDQRLPVRQPQRAGRAGAQLLPLTAPTMMMLRLALGRCRRKTS